MAYESATTNASPNLWTLNILDALLERKWEEVLNYLDETKYVDDDKWHVLHWSCREYTPIAVMKELLHAYPEAALNQDVDGAIPLHIALEYHKPLAVIKLLSESKSLLKVQNSKGRMALHVACFNKCRIEIIDYLIQEFPEAACHKDSFGMTPLHIAVIHEINSMVQLLLEYCPKSASISDTTSETPLHKAVKLNKSHNISRALVSVDISVLTQTNQNNQTPLDVFFSIWDRSMTDFLKSVPSTATPEEIFQMKIGSFSISFIYHMTEILLQSSLILHEAVKSKYCPWSFCELFMRLHPDQLFLQLQNGSYLIEIIPKVKKLKFFSSIYICTGCRRQVKRALPLCKECYEKKRFPKCKIVRLLMPKRNEDLEMLSCLFYSIRENPLICHVNSVFQPQLTKKRKRYSINNICT